MNIYMICTLWTPFQAERDWKNSYWEILLIPLYIFYSLWWQSLNSFKWYCKLSKNIEIYNGFERYVSGNITFIEINKNKTLVTTFHNQKESMTLKVDLFKLIRTSSFKQNNFSCLISFGLQNYFSKSAKFNIMCVHCTLYTVHWILYTIRCTLDTVH